MLLISNRRLCFWLWPLQHDRETNTTDVTPRSKIKEALTMVKHFVNPGMVVNGCKTSELLLLTGEYDASGTT